MRSATVLGAGELGSACAYALAANGAKEVRLLSRDATLASADAAAGSSSSPLSFLFGGRSSGSPPWSSAVHRADAAKALGSTAEFARATQAPLFVCTPVSSYLPARDSWAKETLGSEHNSIAHDALRRWSDAAPSSAPTFVGIFTRGFTADGMLPAQLAEELLRGASSMGGASMPVVVASGPILAKEWALQSLPGDKTASAIPTRPPSALNNVAGSTIVSKTAAAGVSSGLAHAHSGVSLAFATWTPSTCADAGAQRALEQYLQQLFARESVTLHTEADAAAVLSFVNGVAPLCAFGAGLVSCVYAGSQVSALSSYALHALTATEELMNGLLGRPSGTPLPLSAWSTLHSACTCLATREFALGRQLDFYFRKQDAAQAIFRGRAHYHFAASVDGLHSCMQTRGVSSPFFEVLMDTYSTLIRASVAGEGLVKMGYYAYRTEAVRESELLKQATQVDDAMLSGDDARFTMAKENIMKAFPGAVI